MTRMLAVAAALLCGGLSWAGEKFTKDQLNARFYFDLGPSEIDVSSYPDAQKNNYKEFAEHCTKCHTLARPINAPIVDRKDWERFVERMHRRTVIKMGSKMSNEEVKKIVDFLVFDSQRRKVDKKAAFDAQTENLKKLFDEVQKERARLKEEDNRKKAREMPMEMQTQPSPHS